jgi:hypothetical protein
MLKIVPKYPMSKPPKISEIPYKLNTRKVLEFTLESERPGEDCSTS